MAFDNIDRPHNTAEEKSDTVFQDLFKEQLYSVLFHFNHHRNKWFCFDSGNQRGYFNGEGGWKIVTGSGSTVEEAFIEYKNIIDEQSRNSTG